MLSFPVKTGRQIYTISSELKRKIGHICYILIYFYRTHLLYINIFFIFYSILKIFIHLRFFGKCVIFSVSLQYGVYISLNQNKYMGIS